MSAGRRPSLFLISTLARAFSKASTTGASNTNASEKQMIANSLQGWIATMRMMRHTFSSNCYEKTPAWLLVCSSPSCIESRSIQHHSTVQPDFGKHKTLPKLCQNSPYICSFLLHWLLRLQSKNPAVAAGYNRLQPSLSTSAGYSQMQRCGTIGVNWAQCEALGFEAILWKVSLLLTLSCIDLLLRRLRLLKGICEFFHLDFRTSLNFHQCEPSSTIALASNSTLAPRPSRAKCKGLRPCESPGSDCCRYLEVSWNGGTHKSSILYHILIGFSTINHPLVPPF